MITCYAKTGISATCIDTGATKGNFRVKDIKALSMGDIDRVLGIGSKYLGRGAVVQGTNSRSA